MSATEKSLKELHRKLAETMGKMLEEEGVSAATLNAIRSFLSDNDITCEAETNDQMAKLREKLEAKKKKKTTELTEEEKASLGNVVQMYGNREG